MLPFAFLGKVTPFSPSQLSGLKGWWRADLGVTIATGVSGWADQSGIVDGTNRKAVQATAAKQPTLSATDAAYNNKATLGFASAANQSLKTGTWSAALAQPDTIVVIGHSTTFGHFTDGISANHQIIRAEPATPKFTVASNSSTFTPRMLAYGTGAAATERTPVGFTVFPVSPCVCIVTFNNTNSTFYISSQVPPGSLLLDGVDATGSPGVQTATGLTFGISQSGANPMNGSIAEIFAVNRVLTLLERTKILAYAKSAYGLAIADTYVMFDGSFNMFGGSTTDPGATTSLPYVAPYSSTKRFAGYRNDASGKNANTTIDCTSQLSATCFAFVNAGVRFKTLVLLEIQNDLTTNGGSANPADTAYAATAWANLIAYSVAARALGATRIVLCTCLPEGSASGAPANYEALRLAVNALILANYTGHSTTDDRPYFDAIADIGGAGSPIGTLASTADPTLYDAADTSHLLNAGVTQAAIILGPVL